MTIEARELCRQFNGRFWSLDRLLWVGHGRSVPRDDRRFYDLHRPFMPPWPV